METNVRLNLEDGESVSDIGQYQHLVGKLIYLTVTRPDITYAMSMVSQFMHASRTSHSEAIDKILRYLKGTPGQGIWMKKNNTNTIVGFFDADWAGSYDKKSTTGFCTFVGGNLVTWKSKKQNVMARSSAEAEYRAMASTASELIWIKQYLRYTLESLLGLIACCLFSALAIPRTRATAAAALAQKGQDEFFAQTAPLAPAHGTRMRGRPQVAAQPD
eukprot:XP_015577840.1 uncharacterized protein LOC107261645 [Ricinus communis]